MFFGPKPLGRVSLDTQALKEDKKRCIKTGPCGIGKEALYLNSFYLDRIYYVPVRCVTRVFKRVAMSKGGFTGKGVFASIPYLVVEYDGGREKQCIFKYEEKVDQFLEIFHARWPDIPVHSKAAQLRLEEKEKLRAKKRRNDLSGEILNELFLLKRAKEFLEEKPSLSAELSMCAKAKRTNDQSNPAYRWVALAIVLMGLVSAAFGVYSLMTRQGNAVYFLLFGLAAVFLFSGANVLPTKQNNRRYIEQQLQLAVRNMENYLAGYPGFPVPARYAHPVVLEWMKDILEEGRAQDTGSALEEVKKDLKAINSSVTVEEDEFERIMAVKPMFLIWEYQ